MGAVYLRKTYSVYRNAVTAPIEALPFLCKLLPSTGSEGGLFVLEKKCRCFFANMFTSRASGGTDFFAVEKSAFQTQNRHFNKDRHLSAMEFLAS